MKYLLVSLYIRIECILRRHQRILRYANYFVGFCLTSLGSLWIWMIIKNVQENPKIYFSSKAWFFFFEKLQNFQRELITFDAKNEIALLRRFFLNSVKAKYVVFCNSVCLSLFIPSLFALLWFLLKFIQFYS